MSHKGGMSLLAEWINDRSENENKKKQLRRVHPFFMKCEQSVLHFYENRTVLVTISTNQQLASKLRKMFSDIERRS